MNAQPELLVAHKSVQTQSVVTYADVMQVTLWYKTDDHVTVRRLKPIRYWFSDCNKKLCLDGMVLNIL